MEKQIIFEDDHIRAIYLQGTSKTLVISFGDLISRAKGMSINAEKSLSKYDYAVVGIMPKQKSWFPRSSMQALLAHLSPILQNYQAIVAYGGSMGGYAAIKYAKLLQATRVVAMVPQYSINPDVVVDDRYHEFFDPALHHEMEIAANDLSASTEYIVIYDPYYAQDREHYLKIADSFALDAAPDATAKSPQLHTLHLPYTGHDVIAVLASSALLHDFIEHPFDAQHFYQHMRAVKKNSKFYYRSVIARLLGTHNAALGDILKSLDMQLDNQFFDNQLKQNITRILLSNKQVSERDLAKLGIQLNLPAEKNKQVYNYLDHILVFNLISSKLECYAQSVIDMNAKYIIPVQAKATGLARLDVNNEHYFIARNDRQIFKLFKFDAELSSDMHPLIVRKHAEHFSLSYKQWIMSCGAEGQCNFDDDHLTETSKLQVY